MAKIFERIESATNEIQSGESDLMLRLVQCTQDRCRIEREIIQL